MNTISFLFLEITPSCRHKGHLNLGCGLAFSEPAGEVVTLCTELLQEAAEHPGNPEDLVHVYSSPFWDGNGTLGFLCPEIGSPIGKIFGEAESSDVMGQPLVQLHLPWKLVPGHSLNFPAAFHLIVPGNHLSPWNFTPFGDWEGIVLYFCCAWPRCEFCPAKI